MTTPQLAATAVAAVRAALSTSDMTHADLGKALGISADTVGRRLSGESEFSLTEIEMAAAALGTTPADLLGFGNVTVEVNANRNVRSDVDITITT